MAFALHVGLLHSLPPSLRPQQDEQDPECNFFDLPQPVNSLLGLTIPETQGRRSLWVAQLSSQLEKGSLLHSFQVSNDRRPHPPPTIPIRPITDFLPPVALIMWVTHHPLCPGLWIKREVLGKE